MRASAARIDSRINQTTTCRWAENACEALPIVTRLSPDQGFTVDASRNLPDCSGKWWRGTESNCRHYDFQSYALPTELPRHGQARITIITSNVRAQSCLVAPSAPALR